MNKILLFFSLIYSMTANSQSLNKNIDIIDCGYYRIELSIPSTSIRQSQISNYEEGFYKTYSLIDNSFLFVHCGAMTKDVVLSDSVIYECKLGNIAYSISYIRNGKYFRVDKYYQVGRSVSFQFVEKDNLAIAEKILNNIKIIKCH